MSSYSANKFYGYERNALKMMQASQSGLKADVFLEYQGNQLRVVKDFSQSNRILRSTVCGILINREIRALKNIQGIDGVPAYYGRYGKYGFAMQVIRGGHPSKEAFRQSPSLAKQLDRLVNDLHTRGFTHNDLRMKNIIVDPTGKLYLIDFASAFSNKGGLPSILGLRESLYAILKFMDQTKVIRVKQLHQSYRPDSCESIKLQRAKRIRRLTGLWKKLYGAIKSG